MVIDPTEDRMHMLTDRPVRRAAVPFIALVSAVTAACGGATTQTEQPSALDDLALRVRQAARGRMRGDGDVRPGAGARRCGTLSQQNGHRDDMGGASRGPAQGDGGDASTADRRCGGNLPVAAGKSPVRIAPVPPGRRRRCVSCQPSGAGRPTDRGAAEIVAGRQ